MAGRLVEPKVDGDHRLQHRQHFVELVAAGRGQHRVARDRDQRLELPVARCGDFLGHARHRGLPENLLGAADPGVPAAEFGDAALEAGQRLRGDRPGRRLGEHRAAGGVEMAGQNVDRRRPASWPGCQTPGYTTQFGRTPPISRRRRVRAPDAGCVSASMPVTALTRSGGQSAATRRIVSTPSTCGPGFDQVLVKEGMRDGQQQRRVGARHDRKPLVGAGPR